jgi:hypothetical protein
MRGNRRFPLIAASAEPTRPRGRASAAALLPGMGFGFNSPTMEVLRPKELETHPGDEIVRWARGQLEIARSILDNPGGGLLFATQTVGQVKSGLHERDPERWEELVAILDKVEDAAVRREFDSARSLLDEVLGKLPN